jgi:hypothetical protein
MKPRLVIPLLVLALGAGVVVGELHAHYVFKRYTWLAHIVYGAGFAAYVNVQGVEGTPEAYEASLKEFLRSLDASDKWPEDMYPPRYHAFDRIMTYARLAESQAKRGATSESEESMQAALNECHALGWKTCSGPEIQAVQKRLDARYAAKVHGG